MMLNVVTKLVQLGCIRAKPGATIQPGNCICLKSSNLTLFQHSHHGYLIFSSEISTSSGNTCVNIHQSNNGRGIHTSSVLNSARRKKMKVRRNRKAAQMTKEIARALGRDEAVRNALAQSGVEYSYTPDKTTELPKVLQDEVERSMKDPEIRAQYQSGEKGRKTVMDHFLKMGTQIDRLQKMKDFEQKVLEKERMLKQNPNLGRDEGEVADLDPSDENYMDKYQMIQSVKSRQNSMNSQSKSTTGEMIDRSFANMNPDFAETMKQGIDAMIKRRQLLNSDSIEGGHDKSSRRAHSNISSLDDDFFDAPNAHSVDQEDSMDSIGFSSLNSSGLSHKSQYSKSFDEHQSVKSRGSTTASSLPPELEEERKLLMRKQKLREEEVIQGGNSKHPQRIKLQPRQVVDTEASKSYNISSDSMDSGENEVRITDESVFKSILDSAKLGGSVPGVGFVPADPSWPTREQIIANEKEIQRDYGDTLNSHNDVSPLSMYLRAERLRREQDQHEYEKSLAGSSTFPMPKAVREFIAVRLMIGREDLLTDEFLKPYLPPGMDKFQFFEMENLYVKNPPPQIKRIIDEVKQDKNHPYNQRLTTGRLRRDEEDEQLFEEKFEILDRKKLEEIKTSDQRSREHEHREVITDEDGEPYSMASPVSAGEFEEDLQSGEANLDRQVSIEGSDCHSFREAVEKKHIHCLKALSTHFKDMMMNGETELHIAAALDSVWCVNEVLDRQIVKDINVTSGTKSTALHTAALRCNKELVKLLISRGAEVNKMDDEGFTPLHFAVAAGASKHLINYLIDHKANILACDNQGASALHIVAESGNLSLGKLLIQKGVPVDDKTDDGETPLFLAVEAAHLDMVEFLIVNGASVHSRNKYGFTPLHAACNIGNYAIANLLIKKGADVFVKDVGDNMPFHIAALGGHTKLLKLLASNGSPFNELNSEGWNALHMACQGGFLETVEYLSSIGCNVNVRNDEGSTCLHIALTANQFDLSKELVDKFHAQVNISDANGVTPLLITLQLGNEEISTFLLDRGAQVDTLTIDHVSPLHVSLEQEMFSISERLLQLGANPLAATNTGFVPLHMAVATGNIEWVNRLISLGTNPNAMTNAGLTPLKIAIQENDQEMEHILRKAGAKEMDIFAWMEMNESQRKNVETYHPNSIETL